MVFGEGKGRYSERMVFLWVPLETLRRHRDVGLLYRNEIRRRRKHPATSIEIQIAQMAARVSPARPAGNTRKVTRLILRRNSEPGGATPTLQRIAAYYCLSFARLSLAWLFALGRVLT